MTGNKHKNGIICVFPGCNKSMRTQKFKLHFSRSHLRQGEEYTVQHRRQYEIAREKETDSSFTSIVMKNQYESVKTSDESAMRDGEMERNGSTSLKQIPIGNGALGPRIYTASEMISSNICEEHMDEDLSSNSSLKHLDTLTPISAWVNRSHIAQGSESSHIQKTTEMSLSDSRMQNVNSYKQSNSALAISHSRNATTKAVPPVSCSTYPSQKHQISVAVQENIISTQRPKQSSSTHPAINMMTQVPNPQYSVQEMNAFYSQHQLQQQNLQFSPQDQQICQNQTPQQLCSHHVAENSLIFSFENFVERVERRLDHLTNKIDELRNSQSKLEQLIRGPYKPSSGTKHLAEPTHNHNGITKRHKVAPEQHQ